MVSKETKSKKKVLNKKSTKLPQITLHETSSFPSTGKPVASGRPAAARERRGTHHGHTASETNFTDFSNNMTTLPDSTAPVFEAASSYPTPTHLRPLPDKGQQRPQDRHCFGVASKAPIPPAVPTIFNPRRQGQVSRRTNEAPLSSASFGQKNKEGSSKKKDTPLTNKPQSNSLHRKFTGNPLITSQAPSRPMRETTQSPSTSGGKKQKQTHKLQKDTRDTLDEPQPRQGVEDFLNDQKIALKSSPGGSEQPNVDHEISRADNDLAKFAFDSLHPRLRCPKPDCRVMTSCWDNIVVICPACGPDSFTRYCKKEHLYDDIQRHWAVECGHSQVAGPIDRDTIRPSQLPKRPYLVPQMPNMLERHRQAVYRAMEDADYFIFGDLEEIEPGITEPTPAQWNSVRGTGKVVIELRFFDDGSMYSEAQYFNYYIQQALRVGKAGGAEDSCWRAFSMIRTVLTRDGAWREEILSYLCLQLAGEWGGFKVPEFFYNVAEVNAVSRRSQVLPALV